jgi:hypothetical protein
MKVAPVSADMVADEAPPSDGSHDVVLPATAAPKAASARGKRAEAE